MSAVNNLDLVFNGRPFVKAGQNADTTMDLVFNAQPFVVGVPLGSPLVVGEVTNGTKAYSMFLMF